MENFNQFVKKVNEMAEAVEYRTEPLKDKEYVRIYKDNKDIVYIVGYGDASSIKLVVSHNSIGNSYYGVRIESFIESVRGFMYKYPDLLEKADGSVEEYLKGHGFVEVKPSKTDILLYKK